MEDAKQYLLNIIETYNIGKKPLSKLLGWGETTVMNQLKSASASPEFAGKIRALWEDTYLFAEVLEANRSKITDVAYRKAKKAVEARLLKDKARLLIMFIAKHANYDIAPYQIVATLFFSQLYSLAVTGLPLFDDDVFYRPRNNIPYPLIYAELTKNGLPRVRSSVESLHAEDKDIVSEVYRILCGYGPNAVKALFRLCKSDLIKRHKMSEADADGVLIGLTELQSYFTEETDEIGLSEPAGLKKYFERELKK